MKTLLFIDTNIYLDFYRMRTDAGMALLNQLDSIRDQIIVSYQVEMEFKKNRQEALVESITQLKAPANIPRPGVLSDHKAYKALQKDLRNCNKRIGTLKARLQRVFSNPVQHDPVYQVVQRILTKNDPLNLTRKTKEKNLIRRDAFRRFIYGYPPRKKNDTSIGDAVNWEWICRVCEKEKAAVLIVSRDSDYGVTLGDHSYINHWLAEEFRDRVSLQRQIRLTPKLSDALKEFKVKVTPEEQKAETEFIKNAETAKPVPSREEFLRMFQEIEAEFVKRGTVSDGSGTALDFA